MNKQRIAIIAAAGVGVIATFLPWATVLGQSITGMQGSDGIINIILFVPAIILCFLGDKNTGLSIQWQKLTASIPAGLAGAIAIYKIVDLGNAMRGFGKLVSAGAGIGLYLIILAGIAVPVFVFLYEKTLGKFIK